MKRHPSINRMDQPHRSEELENLAHRSHPVLGHGQAGPHQLPLTLGEATEQAMDPAQYIIPVHIVFLHRANTRRLPEPTQIPWLEEIRAHQYLPDVPSEVI